MRKKCAVEGCNDKTWASGERITKASKPQTLIYCRKHCLRFEKYGTTDLPVYVAKSVNRKPSTLEERFWKHTDKRSDDECWNWTADCSRSGYGSLWRSETNNNISAHRYSYELHYGKIDEGMLILHSCDNKKCVNPKHLKQGTVKENTNEAIDRGLRPRIAIPVKFGEQNPRSKLTLEQARFIKAHPEMKLTELASMYGLSPNCIRGVRIGRTWKEA